MGKKLQPKLRFKGFTDDWEQRPFGKVYTRCTEKNNPIRFGVDKIITVASMQYAPRHGCTNNEYLLTYNVMKLGDIAFEGHRNKRFPFGRFVENMIGEGIVSHVFSVYRPIVKQSSLLFLKYYINNDYVIRNMLRKSTIAATMMRTLVDADLMRQTLTLPSGREQEKIGKLFVDIDNLIDAEKRKLDLLQKKKRALLRQIFEQKLRFAGYNNPWERCRLGDITEFADYGIAASAIPYDGTVRYLRITDIDDETRQVNIYELPSPDMKHRSRKEDYLRQGDLVFARTGASVGKTYLNRSDRDDIVHAGFLIRFRLKDNICPEFIYQQTLGENYRKFIAITSQRSGQPGINSSEYADWTLYLTSIEEQNQIGGLFGQLDELIAALTQKIDLLMIKKKALLQQMFV